MADLDLYNQFLIETERKDSRYKGYNRDLRKARPFSLTDEVDAMVGELAYGDNITERDIRQYLLAARLPYPIMWLEHPVEGFARRDHRSLHTLARNGFLLIQPLPDQPGFDVLRISQVINPDGTFGPPSPLPLLHYVDPTGSLKGANVEDRHAPGDLTNQRWGMSDAEHDTLGTYMNEPVMQMCGWGIPPDLLKYAEALKAARDNSDHEALAEILDKAPLSPLYGTSQIMLEYDQGIKAIRNMRSMSKLDAVCALVYSAAREQQSELCYIVAALALMNEVPDGEMTLTPRRAKGSTRARGELRLHRPVTEVSIVVPSRKRISQYRSLMKAGAKTRMGEHAVRGYYRHSIDRPPTNPERWERAIDLTGQRVWRTWVETYKRGDPALGSTKTNYTVKFKPRPEM